LSKFKKITYIYNKKELKIKMSTFKILIIVLLLSSCKTYSVHEQNIIEQNKTMIKYDKKSRSTQQKIRSSRKKVKSNKRYKNTKTKRNFIR